VLDNLAIQSDADHVLLINTGNNFRPGDEPERRRAAVMFKTFSLMGVDCLALSEREFVFGAAFLRELAAKSSVPLICANLKDTGSQASYFMPYLRLKRAGKSILVTSVVDPSRASLLQPQGLKVSDPVASLRKLQKDISHDFLIVVMQTNRATADKWLSKVSGVDVVILGQQRGVQAKAEKLHGAQLLYNCNRGKTVSALEVSLLTGGKSCKAPENFLLRANDFSEDVQIASLIKDFELWLHDYHDKRRNKTRIASTSTSATADQKPPKGGLPAIFQQLIERNKKNSVVFVTGPKNCAKCHQQKFDVWKKSRHARAMATLEKKHRENDPHCYRCHVTGIVGAKNMDLRDGEQNIFARLIASTHQPNVRCEACHGTGLRHAANPDQAGKMMIPDARVCQQCHTPDTDPDFSFKKKKELICQ